ncbi:hypothetical protein ACT453_07040, partial [Bacillus sp. D-CC]
AIAQIEIPAPSVIGDIVEDNSRQLSYKVYQNMPAQSKDIHYAKSFVLESEVNKDFTVSDISFETQGILDERLEIVQESGQGHGGH